MSLKICIELGKKKSPFLCMQSAAKYPDPVLLCVCYWCQSRARAQVPRCNLRPASCNWRCCWPAACGAPQHQPCSTSTCSTQWRSCNVKSPFLATLITTNMAFPLYLWATIISPVLPVSFLQTTSVTCRAPDRGVGLAEPKCFTCAGLADCTHEFLGFCFVPSVSQLQGLTGFQSS